MARLMGGILTRRARRLRGRHFTKRLRNFKNLIKLQDEERMKPHQKEWVKQRGKREYFVCRGCLHRIARISDLLTRVLRLTAYGLFRRVFDENVEEVLHRYEYPGLGNYFRRLYCSHCPAGTLLGVHIDIVAHPETVENALYGAHWVPGNCLLQIFKLRIRRGNFLLDAVTRKEVGHI